ncbi:helix-turn-helix transcriptional regulator [Castellaniella sp. GW247-6E4]|uniref:helix-turn-helix domain-containing protein n=1 Tax=Castellaniella sp. GW247-6E4 TaxID=3140380 RepID=UPI0033156FE1
MKNEPTPSLSPLTLFGQRLAQLRKEQGISQEQLALMSGIARSYVSGVERGKRNISLLNIVLLAQTLKVEPAELLSFTTTIAVKNS